MRFSWASQKRPIIVLSPMAGVTDSAYRQMVKRIAPEVICVTEFLSVDAIVYESKKTLGMLKFGADEQPLIVQVFGKKLEHFVEAAKRIEDLGVAGIDINMGCPARKVIHSDHGSALTKIENVCLAYRIVEEMSRAVKIPISVKTRLGWENAENLIPFCRRLVDSGAKAIMVHGRTTKQQYKGLANWEPIYDLKQSIAVGPRVDPCYVDVPVLGNGDVVDLASYRDRVGPLDGVLIGRGSMGNPWVFREVIDGMRPMVTWKNMKETALTHAGLMVEDKGEDRAMLEMRKFLAYYVKGFDGAKAARARLVRVTGLKEIEEIFDGLNIPDEMTEHQLKRDMLNSKTWQG